MHMATPELSIVIPVYNEEPNIGPLVEEIGQAMPAGLSYEVVYVDDGSTDGTAERVETLGAEIDMDLRLVRHAERRGQSAALVTGVKAARGAWIGTLDGDGQNLPADLPRLYAVLSAAYEQDPAAVCIAGIRRRRQDSALKLFSSRVANAVRQSILNDGVTDTGCGLKVFERDTFLSLPLFDHIHRFIPAMFRAVDKRILVEDVAHRPRRHGESKYGMWNRLWIGIADLIGVRWLTSRILR